MGELAELVPHFDVIHLHGLWLLHCRRTAKAAIEAGRPYVVSLRGMLYRSALTVSRWRTRLALALYQRSVLTEKRLALSRGRLHQTKGLDLLLRAWAQVPAEVRRPWAVVIAGPGAGGYGVQLRRLVALLGLTDEAVFLGPLSDEAKWGWLASSELLVAPVRGENFGNVLPEALLSGVPVMASRELPWQLLDEAGAGWWLPLDEGDWTRGFSEALAMNRESLRAMGTRERARAGHRWIPAKSRRAFGRCTTGSLTSPLNRLSFNRHRDELCNRARSVLGGGMVKPTSRHVRSRSRGDSRAWIRTCIPVFWAIEVGAHVGADSRSGRKRGDSGRRISGTQTQVSAAKEGSSPRPWRIAATGRQVAERPSCEFAVPERARMKARGVR